MQILRFTQQGRSGRSILAIAIWSALLAGLALFLHAAPWLVIALALPLLPALWELWKNPQANLTLDDTKISWSIGARNVATPLADITKARLDTRWDLSVRVTLILLDGKKLRLPPQVTPPHRQFETELHQRGVQTERHHFSVF